MNTVEKDWTTATGLRAVVLLVERGHRCGYVGVPDTHPLHGVEYNSTSDSVQFPSAEGMGKRGVLSLIANPDGDARLDSVFDVHGSLTFSGGGDGYPAPSDGLWWFGFDCAHHGDAPSDEYLTSMREKHPEHPFLWERDPFAVHRDLVYVEQECESLATQLIERVAGAAA